MPHLSWNNSHIIHQSKHLSVRQTDTTVLNPVISPKLRLARFTSALWQSHDHHEIGLTQKEALLEREYFTGACRSLHPTTAQRHVVVPKLSHLPQCLRNVVEKPTRKGWNATPWKPNRSSHTKQKFTLHLGKRSAYEHLWIENWAGVLRRMSWMNELSLAQPERLSTDPSQKICGIPSLG